MHTAVRATFAAMQCARAFCRKEHSATHARGAEAERGGCEWVTVHLNATPRNDNYVVEVMDIQGHTPFKARGGLGVLAMVLIWCE